MDETQHLYDLTKLGTVDKAQWKATRDVTGLKVRGRDYLTDKVKVAAKEPIFELVANDLFKTEERYDHVLSHPENRVAKALKAEQNTPFVFAINFQVPGPPFYSYVVYFTCSESELFGLHGSDPGLDSVDVEEKENDSKSSLDKDPITPGLRQKNGMQLRSKFDYRFKMRRNDSKETNSKVGVDPKSTNRTGVDDRLEKPELETMNDRVFEKICWQFFRGEDDVFRDGRFKIIPKIVSGPMLVKSAVPSNKPAVLGKRLKQRYFRGPGYLELCIDIGSNSIAKHVTKISTSASKYMVVDIFVVLEATEVEELPERLLAVFRANKCDLSKATVLKKP